MNSVHEQCPCTVIQTVTINSALSQNWVGYTVHTPKDPSWAHVERRVVTHWAPNCGSIRPCRRPCRAPCRRPPATTQNCIAIQRSMPRVLHAMSRACRSVPAPYHRALSCCILALLRRIATPKVTPLSQYKNCIVTH